MPRSLRWLHRHEAYTVCSSLRQTTEETHSDKRKSGMRDQSHEKECWVQGSAKDCLDRALDAAGEGVARRLEKPDDPKSLKFFEDFGFILQVIMKSH